MAMKYNDMGDEILAAIDAVSDPTDRQELFRALAKAIVEHIQNNVVVSTSVAVTSVSLVTPGVGTSGPGTGTGTGTVA